MSSPAFTFETAVEELTHTATIPLLLVEADVRMRRAFARILTLAGYNVACAVDAQDALEMAERQPFPLVVSSLELPRLDGAALAMALHERDPYSECILLGETGNLPRILEAVEAGCVYDFFFKPMTEAGGLVRCLARALERRELRLSHAALLIDQRDALERIRGLYSRLEQFDKAASLGQIADTITGDLESPLKSLLAYAQFLQARLKREEEETLTQEQLERVNDYLREMERGVKNCCATVQAVKEYACLQEQTPGPVNVVEVIEKALGMVEHSLTALGIGVEVRLDTALPPVLANPQRLQQALLSLVRNAQQALGTTGGTLTLAVERMPNAQGEEEDVCLRITDTGPGISPAILPHIFDPFFTTKPRSENLGIGLTIARKMLREWRGDLLIESAPGAGTTARLILKACVEAAVPVQAENVRKQKAA